MAQSVLNRRKAAGNDLQSHPGCRMTEQEFVSWMDEKTRAEWVDGEVIVMPAMSFDHDVFTFWLRSVVQAFVQDHSLGFVLGPEFSVRLPRQRRRRMPDLLFVARGRASIVHPNHVEGAPDLIMELVSPESVSRDREDKYLDYQSARVREYWVIDRQAQRVDVYGLSRGKYKPLMVKDGRFTSSVLKGFYLRPEWLLAEAPPRLGIVLKALGVAV